MSTSQEALPAWAQPDLAPPPLAPPFSSSAGQNGATYGALPTMHITADGRSWWDPWGSDASIPGASGQQSSDPVYDAQIARMNAQLDEAVAGQQAALPSGSGGGQVRFSTDANGEFRLEIPLGASTSPAQPMADASPALAGTSSPAQDAKSYYEDVQDQAVTESNFPQYLAAQYGDQLAQAGYEIADGVRNLAGVLLSPSAWVQADVAAAKVWMNPLPALKAAANSAVNFVQQPFENQANAALRFAASSLAGGGVFKGGTELAGVVGRSLDVSGDGAAAVFGNTGSQTLDGAVMNSGGDRLVGTMGPARLSHPEQYDAIMQDLANKGVDVDFSRPGQFAYGPSATPRDAWQSCPRPRWLVVRDTARIRPFP